jgi:hypothetical protein
MHVELLVAKPIGPACRALHKLGTHNIGIKPIGPSPIRHMDDAVIQFGWHHFGLRGVECRGNVITADRQVGNTVNV